MLVCGAEGKIRHVRMKKGFPLKMLQWRYEARRVGVRGAIRSEWLRDALRYILGL